MHRSHPLVLLAGSLVALTLVMPAAALDAPRTIRVHELFSDDEQLPPTVVDVNDDGEGPGDYFLFADPLYNSQRQLGKARGAQVGRVDGVFTIGAERSGSVRVLATFFFPDGKLEVGGALRENRVSVVPVLGGTGAYANARGTVKATDRRDRTDFVIRLFPID